MKFFRCWSFIQGNREDRFIASARYYYEIHILTWWRVTRKLLFHSPCHIILLSLWTG